MNKIINIKNKKGFTIIETLVAITILMIAVAGPLTIAQKGLTASVYARDQVTASFLAQELMEYNKSQKRLNWSNSICNSGNTTELVRFTRSCAVTSINSDEIKVTVTVTWTNGNIPNNVTLVSHMFNVKL